MQRLLMSTLEYLIMRAATVKFVACGSSVSPKAVSQARQDGPIRQFPFRSDRLLNT